MGKTYVKNGTPVGSSSLCDTCVHAHIMHGYRESETIVACMFSYDHPLVVPFKVRECTNHEHKNRPTWEQMEKLALPIMQTTTSKKAGFLTSGRSDDEEDDN